MTTPDELGGFPALARLRSDERAAVAATASAVSYRPGEQLFGEGGPASGCWLIRSGRVALQTVVPGRGDVVINTVAAHDVLGWSWIVPPERWHFTAVAAEPVDALLLDTAALRDAAERDPALGYHLVLGLFEVLLARLQSTRARLLDLYGSPGAY